MVESRTQVPKTILKKKNKEGDLPWPSMKMNSKL